MTAPPSSFSAEAVGLLVDGPIEADLYVQDGHLGVGRYSGL